LTFDPKFELGRDFRTAHLTAKFHRLKFNRSEVIVRTNKHVDKLTNKQTPLKTYTALRYATPVANKDHRIGFVTATIRSLSSPELDIPTKVSRHTPSVTAPSGMERFAAWRHRVAIFAISCHLKTDRVSAGLQVTANRKRHRSVDHSTPML